MNIELQNHWNNLVLKAKRYAHAYHRNQMYSEEFPYVMHLQAVEGVLLRFGITIPELRAAAWLHDVLEDTTATYENLLLEFNEPVALIVAAVTEPKGGNRKWRHDNTYPRIRKSQEAVLVKLADRIANVEAGWSKFRMYQREYPEFKKQLHDDDLQYEDLGYTITIRKMWSYLDSLMEE